MVDFGTIARGDDTSTNAILSAFESDDLFLRVAAAETESILSRDREDEEKLQKGIQLAIDKNVLSADIKIEPITTIDVLGKSADQVASEIASKLGSAEGGKVIVFQGLSGTGKGTTVAKLQKILPNAVTWSNGNLFRSITLLAVTWCEQNNTQFSEDMLTPERIAEFVSMLAFGKFRGEEYDIKIEGLGMKVFVSDVVNTDLKSAKVTTNIPTVAKVTQGEVVKFAGAAVTTMGADGYNVLVEGREATVNYIRSPYRFELTLSDKQLIGKRRCAQKMMASAQKQGSQDSTPEQTLQFLRDSLKEIAATWNLAA